MVQPNNNCPGLLQDTGGLNGTAALLITVEDFDNLNPHFSHSWYQAFILENTVRHTETKV